MATRGLMLLLAASLLAVGLASHHRQHNTNNQRQPSYRLADEYDQDQDQLGQDTTNQDSIDNGQQQQQPKAFQSGRQYVFTYDGQIATGLDTNGVEAGVVEPQQKSVSRIQAQAQITFQSDSQAILRLKDVRIGQLNKHIEQPEQVLPMGMFDVKQVHEDKKTQLERPLQFDYQQGVVSNVQFHIEDHTWSKNVKRSVLNLIQVNLKQQESDSDEQAGQQDPKTKSFTVQETTIEGDCQTVYTINKNTGKDDERQQRRTSEEDEGMQQQTFNVTKAVDFKKCKRIADIGHGYQTEQEQAKCSAQQCQQQWYQQLFKNAGQRNSQQQQQQLPCGQCDPKEIQEKKLDRTTVMRFTLTGQPQGQFAIKRAELVSQYVYKSVSAQNSRYSSSLQAIVAAQLVFRREQQAQDQQQLQQQLQQVRHTRSNDDKSNTLLYDNEWDVDEKRFYMDGDDEFGRNAPFVNVPNKVEQAQQLLRKLISAASDKNNGVEFDQVVQLQRLVELFRMCTVEELKQIQSSVSSKGGQGQSGQGMALRSELERKKAEQILADCLAIAGTRNTIFLLTEQITQGNLDSTQAFQALKSLNGLVAPSDKQVEIIQNLCQHEAVHRSTALKQTCWLTFGSMVNELCQPKQRKDQANKNADGQQQDSQQLHAFGQQSGFQPKNAMCQGQKKENYKQALMEQLNNAQTTYEKVLALKALGNAGIDTSVMDLQQVIQDKREDPVVRCVAIDALRRLRTQMPRKIQRVLLPIFQNTKENKAVRMTAFHRIMDTQPEQPVVDQCVYTLVKERCPEVQSFVYTSMKALSKSKEPSQKLIAKHLKAALKLVNVEESTLRPSRRYQLPIYSDEQREGLFVNLMAVFNANGMLPSHVSASLDSLINDQYTLDKIQLSATQRGIEQWYEQLMEAIAKISSDRRSSSSQQQQNQQQQQRMRARRTTYGRQYDENPRDQMSKIRNSLNIQDRQQSRYGMGQQQRQGQNQMGQQYGQQQGQQQGQNQMGQQFGQQQRQGYMGNRGQQQDRQGQEFGQQQRQGQGQQYGQQQQQENSQEWNGRQIDDRAFAMICMRIDDVDQAMLPLDYQTVPQPLKRLLRGDQPSLRELINSLNEKQMFRAFTAMNLKEQTAKIPTTIGLPLRVQQATPLMLSIEGDAKAQMESYDEGMGVKAAVNVHSSISVAHIQKMECWTPTAATGVVTTQAIEVNAPIQAEIKTENGIKITLKTPQVPKTRIFGLHSLPTTYIAEWDNRMKMLREPKVKAIHNYQLEGLQRELRTTIGEQTIGLPLRVQGHYHRPATITDYKQMLQLLMSTENHVHINFEPKEQAVREIVVRIEGYGFQKTDGQKHAPELDNFYSNAAQFHKDGSNEDQFSEDMQLDNHEQSRSKLNNFLNNYQPQSMYHHQLKLSMETQGGRKQAKAELKIKGACDSEFKFCKGSVDVERSPLLREENTDWKLTSKVEVLCPDSVTNVQDLGQLSDKNQKFIMKADTEWGANGKQQINLRVQGLKAHTRDQRNRIQDYNGAQQKYQKKRTEFVNKFDVVAEYKLKPEAQNLVSSGIELIKLYNFWNTETKIQTNGHDGQARASLVIDPIGQQYANVTLETPRQRVRIENVELPAQIRPFPLVRQANRPMHSVQQFLGRVTMGKRRAECSVDGKRVDTFDGVVYKAPLGKCYSVLAKDCRSSQPRFIVLMKALSEDGQEKKIKVITPEQTVECQPTKHQGKTKLMCKLNGQQVGPDNNQPQQDNQDNNGQQIVEWSSQDQSEVTINVEGVTVRFGCWCNTCNCQKAWIKISERYREGQCGLCGHYDENAENDLRKGDNQQAGELADFHRSYSYKDEECSDQDQNDVYQNKKDRFKRLGMKNHLRLRKHAMEMEDEEEDQQDQQWRAGHFNSDEQDSSEEVQSRRSWHTRSNKRQQPYRRQPANKDRQQQQRGRKGVEPIQQTKVIEFTHKVCFSNQPIKQCPDGTMPDPEDQDGEPKKAQFVCLLRTQPDARKMQKDARNGVIVDTEGRSPSFVEPITQPGRCVPVY